MKIPQNQFYRKDKNTPAPNQRASSGQEKPFLCACGEKVSRETRKGTGLGGLGKLIPGEGVSLR